LWAAPRAELNRCVALLTRHELMEDPDDYVATHLRAMAAHLSLHSKHLAALYLMAHGLIKAALAALNLVLALLVFMEYSQKGTSMPCSSSTYNTEILGYRARNFFIEFRP